MKLTTTPEWKKLSAKYKTFRDATLSELFAGDRERAERFSITVGDIFADFSKNRIDGEVLDLLLQLARCRGVEELREAMFRGGRINSTENRAVLHTALRNPDDGIVILDGQNVMQDIIAERRHMREFSQAVRSGKWTGFTGKRIRYVVNIGIGGSDLGPVMAYEALKSYSDRSISCRFISNIDATHFAETVRDINPEETLFIIASKKFTTEETLTNAGTARNWLLETLKEETAIRKHFVAISAHTEAVRAFGIDERNMFRIWDWVGGRYSLSSSIGLSLMIAIGPEAFDDMLHGMHDMDVHFRTAPLEKNLPVILGLIGIWYIDFFGWETHAILPYDQSLSRFPAFLQQLDMESNGKSVNNRGRTVGVGTGPVIWGEPGTNGQHSFYQLLHQGSRIVPADFIGFAQTTHPIGDHHDRLMGHCFVQTQALAFGQNRGDLEREGTDAETLPFRICPGNRPTTSLLIKKLTPYSLGELVSLYEHKIFTQGCLWDIDSFDQFGVELGKKLAKRILPDLKNGVISEKYDGSTVQLMQRYLKWRKE